MKALIARIPYSVSRRLAIWLNPQHIFSVTDILYHLVGPHPNYSNFRNGNNIQSHLFCTPSIHQNVPCPLSQWQPLNVTTIPQNSCLNMHINAQINKKRSSSRLKQIEIKSNPPRSLSLILCSTSPRATVRSTINKVSMLHHVLNKVR